MIWTTLVRKTNGEVASLQKKKSSIDMPKKLATVKHTPFLGNDKKQAVGVPTISKIARK
jgi:hypothetical protein